MAQCQLRNRLGGSTRGVHDLDAVLFGILDVDVVHADTAADDELQLGALRLVNMVCADLRLRADDDCVEVPQSLAQLIGLIELLNDLMALLTQLRHCGLVHTVSNKNTHFSNLL